MFCEVLVGRVVVGFVLLSLTTCIVHNRSVRYCLVLYLCMYIEDKEKYLDLGGSRFSNDLNTFENLIT